MYCFSLIVRENIIQLTVLLKRLPSWIGDMFEITVPIPLFDDIDTSSKIMEIISSIYIMMSIMKLWRTIHLS